MKTRKDLPLNPFFNRSIIQVKCICRWRNFQRSVSTVPVSSTWQRRSVRKCLSFRASFTATSTWRHIQEHMKRPLRCTRNSQVCWENTTSILCLSRYFLLHFLYFVFFFFFVFFSNILPAKVLSLLFYLFFSNIWKKKEEKSSRYLKRCISMNLLASK